MWTRNVVVEPARIAPWDGHGYRLIPSRFPPVSVYEGLTANDRTDELEAIERLTNPRHASADRLHRADPSLAAGADRLQNWNHAPFAYGNPEGSLFFDETRPCLELADGPQTALVVSVARRERFLERTREQPIGLDMRMLKTPLAGRFLDLRAEGAIADKERRRVLGKDFPVDLDGILYRPTERPSGFGIAVLKASVLGRSLQTTHYRYLWNGSRISMLYAFDKAGTEHEPRSLAGPEDVIIAA